MKIQSRTAQGSLDPYFTPIEAIKSLREIERLPKRILEPAAGDGAIVKPLRAAGHKVIAREIVDYGAGYPLADYLKARPVKNVDAIVTNPPYKLALQFAEKATSEVPYVAFLLRTNWLESTGRLSFFRVRPPTRIWIASRRLPMMHRLGWTGPKAPSNTAHAWFIWDRRGRPEGHVSLTTALDWFDWKEHV